MAFRAEVKFKKLCIDAVTPIAATDGSSGFDLVATTIKKVYNPDNSQLLYIEYGTGIAVEIPPGYCCLALQRSSVSNTSLMLSNGVGLIDNDYRGEIKYRFRCNFSTVREYALGQRIGQLLFLPKPLVAMIEVTELSSTDRGTNGYGSTGQEYLGG